MGGCAYLIWGHLQSSQVLQNPTDAAESQSGSIAEPLSDDFRSYLESLRPDLALRLLDSGERRRPTSPADGLAAQLRPTLLHHFLGFLRQQLEPAWPASQSLLTYLTDCPPVLYLRQMAQYPPFVRRRFLDEPAEWYLQIHLMGQSGYHETSAAIAAHWVEIWFRQNRREIDRLLLAAGFRPVQGLERVAAAFVPLAEGGYAEFLPARPAGERSDGISYQTEETESGFSRVTTVPHLVFHKQFAVDRATYEQKGGSKVLDELTRDFGELMVDGKCRCQLCSS